MFIKPVTDKTPCKLQFYRFFDILFLITGSWLIKNIVNAYKIIKKCHKIVNYQKALFYCNLIVNYYFYKKVKFYVDIFSCNFTIKMVSRP